MLNSRPLPLHDVRITDDFFAAQVEKMRTKMLPYQWEVLNDRVEGAEKSWCIHNFEIAAGLKEGEFGGMVFQDTDMAKWLEAVAYSLETHPDPELEAKAETCIDLLEKAQWEDGYINTYFTLKEPDRRWENLLECHELYTAGHFIEAAVAYYKATGKDRMLNILCRFADCICRTFGPGEDQKHGYPGHQEIELALVKLYRVTGCRRYLDTAAYFINQRGQQPLYFHEEVARNQGKYHFGTDLMYDATYSQYHLPVREQTTAEGHAVRAMYMFCAMADLAGELPDDSLLQACRVLFDDIETHKMYITAGIGSAEYGERFTGPYDLPNDRCYCETCASIGLALFALRMANLTGESRYADVMERALYNTVLAGASSAFTEFFYVNPLETVPRDIAGDPALNHVKPVRQKWFGVACCPTNIARTLGSLGQYVCAETAGSITVHLYLSARIQTDGAVLTIDSEYLKGGASLKAECSRPTVLRLRCPAAAPVTGLWLNGAEQPVASGSDGYIRLELSAGTHTVKLQFDMQPRFWYSNTHVSADAGKVAVVRGPQVYCAEECDNGPDLCALAVDTSRPPEDEPGAQLPDGMTGVTVEGWREEGTAALYSTEPPTRRPVRIRLVPYYSWNNRGEGEMRVWLRAEPKR